MVKSRPAKRHLVDIMQDVAALQEYVNQDLARRIEVAIWLQENERRRIDTTVYGVRGRPSPLTFLSEGWHQAYLERAWSLR